MEKLSCKKVAESVIASVKRDTELFTTERNRRPGLAVVLVGDNPASQTYVRNKTLKAEECGFLHFQYNFGEDVSESELLSLIDKLNCDAQIDGILVQLPLPESINEEKVVNAIKPEKDVDGFTYLNVGLLATGHDALVPCTAIGILDILRYFGVETCGKNVTVIGRSNIVGKPVFYLLSQKGIDSTVTLCNTKTENLKEHTLNADIIIVATGHRNTIDSTYVKDGAVVIDVGINRVEDKTKEKGFRLEGDVDFASFKDRDVKITPVPGGVGLMTVAELMKNTLIAAKRR